LVRTQQTQPSLQVAKIHVVEFGRAHDVVEGRHCAELVRPLCEIGIGRVDVGGLAEIEDMVAELHKLLSKYKLSATLLKIQQINYKHKRN
ncbi:unnamed protein product, partial [Prunus brigantina]